METGQRGVNARDIRDLAGIYDLDPAVQQHLADLAGEGKQQAWWQSRNLYYSTYVGLESEAASIRDFGLGLIPGLLQTADYARAVLNSTRPALEPDVIEQRVADRMLRQQLLVSEQPPRFETVVDEAVLHRVPASKDVMRVQLDRLIEASELDTVDIRVLPFRAGLLPSNTNKFIILSFAQPTLPEVVFIEHLTGDIYLERAEDVQAYEATFRLMRDMAATPAQTRDMIRSYAAALAD